ncbi:hypothetical protein [Candidatus Mycoplasma haematobovis]|uniref:hypothetical protein n=1 Tax=Candidatus Mycoplasma haematobovis TaxID=432608 RepID=UPI00164FF45C|nr:hypothetical protein [Candidatus Mycoplasma haematobovis]
MFTPAIVMELLIDLIMNRNQVFSLENLHFKRGGGEHYFAEKVFWWIEEAYYLFGKIAKKDQLIDEIIEGLELARESATIEIIENLDDKLELFLKNKSEYLISL